MGEAAIIAERDEPALLLELLVNQNGGVTGLTGVVALRRGDTDDSYLDFVDGTFKTAGWTTRQAALTEISAVNAPGKYVRRVDLSPGAATPITIPASTDFLVAEYSVTGSFVGVAQDIIVLVAAVKDIADYLETSGPNPHGAGAWDAVSAITPQAVRDAMKLAPTAGAPAAGSVDEHLDTIEGRVDVATSTRESEASAAAREATNTAEHAATLAAIGGLNNISIADVQTALTNQGYTTTVAADLAVAILEIARIHQIHGLDLANPLTITDTGRTVGTIVQTIADALGSTVVTRTA